MKITPISIEITEPFNKCWRKLDITILEIADRDADSGSLLSIGLYGSDFGWDLLFFQYISWKIECWIDRRS